MSNLLDAFTRLLAYLGDAEAADGYQNNNNFVQRNNILSKREIFALLPKIRSAIMGNAMALNNIDEDDIYNKVEEIIALSNQFPDEKDELIEYITDLIIQIESELSDERQNYVINNVMHIPQNQNNRNTNNPQNMFGGAKKSSKKRKSKKRVNRKKSRKSRSRVRKN